MFIEINSYELFGTLIESNQKNNRNSLMKSFKNYFLELFFMSSQLIIKTTIRVVFRKFHLFF